MGGGSLIKELREYNVFFDNFFFELCGEVSEGKEGYK